MSRENDTPDGPTADALKLPPNPAFSALEVELGADSFLNLSLEEQSPGAPSGSISSNSSSPAACASTALSTIGLEWVGKGATTSGGLLGAEVVTGQFLDRATLLESGLSAFVTCPKSLRNQVTKDCFVVSIPNPALRHAARWCQSLKAEQNLIRLRVASSKAVQQVFDGPQPTASSERRAGMVVGDNVLVAQQQGVWRRGRILAIAEPFNGTPVFRCVLDGNTDDAFIEVSRSSLRAAPEDSLSRAHKMDATARACKFSESFPLTVSINLSLAVLRSVGTAGNSGVLEAALQSLFELLSDADDAALFNLTGRGAVVSCKFNHRAPPLFFPLVGFCRTPVFG